jgi:hypothetical protein
MVHIAHCPVKTPITCWWNLEKLCYKKKKNSNVPKHYEINGIISMKIEFNVRSGSLVFGLFMTYDLSDFYN